VLYPLSDKPYWLVSVQLLDGVGAGIYGALFPLVVADLTRGTGHFNASRGALSAETGPRTVPLRTGNNAVPRVR
jgi:hypothetical protein